MKKIMQKYNIRAPRYTSYPPATEFQADGFGPDKFKQILIKSNKATPGNISIYLHFPYCPQRCHFCGCNSYLEKSPEKSSEYIDALLTEMQYIFKNVDRGRQVSQIHWGGGTPNSLDIGQVSRVMEYLNKNLIISDKAEVAMECNPAYLTGDYIRRLKKLGFNRLSLGIQDFDPHVLNAVNRAVPPVPVAELTGMIRSEGFEGVNFDFIYGLPLQTRESFIRNLEKAIEIRPDRLVTFSYAHVPWMKEEQKQIEAFGLPDPGEKLDMFLGGMEKILSSGYKMIGMDHYALPGDILGRASENRQLHRNFQGYCTKETTGQVYAFGASAISQLQNAYLQNTRQPEDYIKAVNDNGFAIQRGYELSGDEIIIGAAITELMCNGRLNIEQIALEKGIDPSTVRNILEYDQSRFSDLEDDGLLMANEEEIILTNTGKLLSRVVAMRLDPNIKENQNKFSRTI